MDMRELHMAKTEAGDIIIEIEELTDEFGNPKLRGKVRNSCLDIGIVASKEGILTILPGLYESMMETKTIQLLSETGVILSNDGQ